MKPTSKPHFMLHCRPTGPGANRALYWSCAVTFLTTKHTHDSTDADGTVRGHGRDFTTTKHSGPCATAASAIGEAMYLWRKYGVR